MSRLTSKTLPFPTATDNKDGTVTFTFGKIQWSEQADTPLLRIDSDEEAAKEHGKRWVVGQGFSSYAELFKDPAKLAEYHAQSGPLKVRG